MSFTKRLSGAWNVLLGKENDKSVSGFDGSHLDLKSELASVKLDLAESQDKLKQERSRLDSMESSQSDQVDQRIESNLEDLFKQLAAPMSQLRMQESLIEKGTDVKSTDIMAVAGNLVSTIEKAGLESIGTTGHMIEFDPEFAQPLGSGSAINTGDKVVVKIIGYRYKGRVIHKAFVEKVT